MTAATRKARRFSGNQQHLFRHHVTTHAGEPAGRTPMLTMLHERWNDLDWRIDAVCRDLNPEIFFPVGVTGQAVEQIAVAKSHCAGCPANGQCLEFAVTTNQEYGVWGGTTEDERRVLRRQWRADNRRAARRRRADGDVMAEAS